MKLLFQVKLFFFFTELTSPQILFSILLRRAQIDMSLQTTKISYFEGGGDFIFPLSYLRKFLINLLDFFNVILLEVLSRY